MYFAAIRKKEQNPTCSGDDIPEKQPKMFPER